MLAEPIEPGRDPPTSSRFVRPSPNLIGAAETIARYISKLVQLRNLFPALEAKGPRCPEARPHLFHPVDCHAQAVRVGTAKPVRDAKRLTGLLRHPHHTIDPGFGIEVMTLAASVAEPLIPRQSVSALVEEAAPDVSDLVDLLANRIGEHAVYRAAPVSSDVPERSVRRIPALSPDTGAGWPGHWPRPSAPAALEPEPIDDGGAPARPSAGVLHLARRPPEGAVCVSYVVWMKLSQRYVDCV